MPEWIREDGIGEWRMALIEDDRIVEARILLDGIVAAGSKLLARLASGGRNAVARDDAGTEYLLPAGAPGVAEGGAFDMIVTRSAIPGAEPWKRPLARAARPDDQPDDQVAAKPGTLPPAWDDVIEEARSGTVRFAGGELRISPTPAMTLIDVDGQLDPAELALTGAAAAARAIRRLDIGGSIGIDLPTAGSKAARNAAAATIDAHLPQPFERTAVNGFGFVQIVRPRRRASLIELAQDRAAFEARALLRRAGFEPPGPKCLVAHPAVLAILQTHSSLLDQLARQIGGAVSLRAEPSVAMSGGYAEAA